MIQRRRIVPINRQIPPAKCWATPPAKCSANRPPNTPGKMLGNPPNARHFRSTSVPLPFWSTSVPLLFPLPFHFCSTSLPEGLPRGFAAGSAGPKCYQLSFCHGSAGGFAKVFWRMFCRACFAIVRPKVLPRGFAACSAGPMLRTYFAMDLPKVLQGVLPQVLPGLCCGPILLWICRRFCQGLLPHVLPGLFCYGSAEGFAKGFCRMFCWPYFDMDLPKVLPRSFAACSAGPILP